jgi:tetratricopeptide (TPR) repeat protein
VKPLGTITICFPHVDDETRNILQSVIDEADNFADFTERLCSLVISRPTPMLTQYCAYFFPFHISNYNLTDKLVAAGKAPDLVEPLILTCRFRRGEVVEWDEMIQSLSKALKAAPNDWIAIHLYTKWRFYAEFNFPESDTDVGIVQRVAKRIEEDKEFKFFKSYLLRFDAIKASFNLNTRTEIELVEKALEIAEKFDEQVVIADLLYSLAGVIKFTDEKRGVALYKAATELSERLGYRYKIGQNRRGLGVLMGQRGELNTTIKYLLEYLEVRKFLGLSVITLNGLIAFFYNDMGDGENALNHAEAALRASKKLRRLTPFKLAMKAWALINLGRYDEARANLDTSQELATKSGSVWYWFMWNQLVEGLLYKAEERFDIAITTLTDVLQFPGEDPIPHFEAICLLHLTDIEIERESLASAADSSGPWMQKFEEFIETRDAPGFAARLLILKAKLKQKQGQYDEVRKILKEVEKIAETSSMRYLKNIVATTFPDAIQRYQK